MEAETPVAFISHDSKDKEQMLKFLQMDSTQDFVLCGMMNIL